ncbi:MAG TPA: serine/threonine-protein kinase, partial [Longimicrobiales bacterium]
MSQLDTLNAAVLQDLHDEYEILGELGRGGTSVVYHARERELGRDVAIKIVGSNQVDEGEAAARLAREARLVALLSHPNIVPLLGIRHLSGGLALIMQHVPGRTLKRTIREDGPLPVGAVEHVLRDIAAALDYAHRRRIVHRDLKPENIYVDVECGRALLADFGIARTTESESTLTLVGTALGTPAYMSPEQIDGITLDGRSDLYSLGLVAYEMLTGQQPWAGCNLYTIIYKQKHDQLPALASFRNDVPEYLERSVDSLLRKDREERCRDAAEFLALLPATTTLSYTPRPQEPPASAPLPTEDAPTLRYQRDMIDDLEPEPEAEPAEPYASASPVEQIEPAVEPVVEAPAAPAVFALHVDEPSLEPQVEEQRAPQFELLTAEHRNEAPVLGLPYETTALALRDASALVPSAAVEQLLAEIEQDDPYATVLPVPMRARRRYMIASAIGLVVVGATAMTAMIRDGGDTRNRWETIPRTASAALRPLTDSSVLLKVTNTAAAPKREPAAVTQHEVAKVKQPVEVESTPLVAAPNISLPNVEEGLKAADF